MSVELNRNSIRHKGGPKQGLIIALQNVGGVWVLVFSVAFFSGT